MTNDRPENAGAGRRNEDTHAPGKEDRAAEKPMTLGELLEAFKGLDRNAPVLVGIINGPRFNAAYAQPQVCAGTNGGMAAYLCCYEEPLPWEGPAPTVNEDGTATLKFDPSDPKPEPFG